MMECYYDRRRECGKCSLKAAGIQIIFNSILRSFQVFQTSGFEMHQFRLELS